MDNSFTRYRIEDRSYVAFIKREIRMRTAAAKFREVDAGKIDIIVSELTSNLVKHAGEGELLYRIVVRDDVYPVFEVIGIDKGPGIEDLPRAMKDGSSSVGTLGQGLGSMERLSNLFQVMSMRNWGTVVYSKVGRQEKNSVEVDLKALLVAKAHEEFCGDGCAVVQSKSFVKILFGDGLGHGKYAYEAMEAAKECFHNCQEIDPVDILRSMHEHVRKTRGLVATVVVLDLKENVWNICGVGNISSRMYRGADYRTCMPYNGTIGMNIPNSMRSTPIAVEKNQHLIMCTDGILSRWGLNSYPNIFKYDPFILAGAVYKDFARGNDDASVLVAKII